MDDDYDTHSLSAKLNVVRHVVRAMRVLHVERWFLTAESHFPKLQNGPSHEADAQNAEYDRDSNLPGLPSVVH